MCHVCKHKQDMPPWKRTYYCVNCGLVMDRDEDSAVNMYQRFVAWATHSTLSAVYCMSVQ
jgi:putative transposase